MKEIERINRNYKQIFYHLKQFDIKFTYIILKAYFYIFLGYVFFIKENAFQFMEQYFRLDKRSNYGF